MSAACFAFNSRPHTEVDIDKSTFYRRLAHFQLTTSHGGRLAARVDSGISYPFQLTTSHGGRHCRSIRDSRSNHLSTHDLTRRSTLSLQLFSLNNFLSTHDLTRRSTADERIRLGDILTFNSRPHTEVDSKFLYFFTVSAYFLLIYAQIIHYISFYVLYFFSFPPYCFILLVRIPRHFLFAAHSH